MKIQIHKYSHYFDLISSRMAADVHACVVSMQLRAIDHRLEGKPRQSWRDDSCTRRYINEIRALIRSIPDKSDRYYLISQIRFHFVVLRNENQTATRWQDYIESVRQVRQRRNRRNCHRAL